MYNLHKKHIMKTIFLMEIFMPSVQRNIVIFVAVLSKTEKQSLQMPILHNPCNTQSKEDSNHENQATQKIPHPCPDDGNHVRSDTAAALSVRLPDRQRARLLRRAEAVGLVWCHFPCRCRQHELLVLFL